MKRLALLALLVLAGSAGAASLRHRLTISIAGEAPKAEASPAAPTDKPGTFIAGSETGAMRVPDPAHPIPNNGATWHAGSDPTGGSAPIQVLEDDPFQVATERPVPIQFRTRPNGTSPALRGTTTWLQPAVLDAHAHLSASGEVTIDLTPEEPTQPANGNAAPPPLTKTVRGRLGEWITVSTGVPGQGGGLWLRVEDDGVVPGTARARPR